MQMRHDVLTNAAMRFALGLVLPLGLVAFAIAASADGLQDKKADDKGGKADAVQKDNQPPKDAKSNLGLTLNDAKAFQGYTLVAPMGTFKTYLLDIQGNVVKMWQADSKPGHTAYLLPNGHMLRAGELRGKELTFVGGGGGSGGIVQEFTWEGELVWDFKFCSPKQLPHHDVPKLPNGNVFLICWEKKTSQEVAAAGRKVGGTLVPDCILEIKQTGKTTGEVVWEWHLWDHLIQDNDKTKANYGDVAAHPELVDVNLGDGTAGKVTKQQDLDKLKGLGYLGAGPPGKAGPDWTHINCVDYNADLDQIMLSVHNFSEVWIIDHSTTTAEAASHKGGKSGQGGDLLYRWGNPRSYRAGTVKDRQLFEQHNAHWIPKGLPGAGHVLVFNNGTRRSDSNYSSVDEFVLPVNGEGKFELKTGAAYGPEKPLWSYVTAKKTDFYSSHLSGAQRLPNGDTLICAGAVGIIFEVSNTNETVWKYLNPVKGGGPGGKGPGGPGGPGKKGDDKGFDKKDGNDKKFDPKGQAKAGPGKGGPGGGSVFRVYRYAPDFPAFAGRELIPQGTIEEIEAKGTKKGTD